MIVKKNYLSTRGYKKKRDINKVIEQNNEIIVIYNTQILRKRFTKQIISTILKIIIIKINLVHVIHNH